MGQHFPRKQPEQSETSCMWSSRTTIPRMPSDHTAPISPSCPPPIDYPAGCPALRVPEWDSVINCHRNIAHTAMTFTPEPGTTCGSYIFLFIPSGWEGIVTISVYSGDCSHLEHTHMPCAQPHRYIHTVWHNLTPDLDPCALWDGGTQT